MTSIIDKTDSHKSEKIESVARHWAMLTTSGDMSGDDVLEFEAWLLQSPLHVDAFEKYQGLINDLGAVSRTIFEGADEEYESEKEKYRTQSVNHFAKRQIFQYWPMHVVGVLVFVIGLYFMTDSDPSNQIPTSMDYVAEYQTDRAETKDIVLRDDSRVTLGANSRMRVHFTTSERRINLVAGEAMFNVEKDVEKPFLVYMDERFVRVVGTRFNISRKKASVSVSVAEGIVDFVSPKLDVSKLDFTNNSTGEKSSPTTSVEKHVLTAGDQIVSDNKSHSITRKKIAVEDVGAWRDGRLSYEDALMSDVISDINRYVTEPIWLDKKVASISVTASFKTSQIDAFIEGLKVEYDLELVVRDYGKVLILSQGNVSMPEP